MRYRPSCIALAFALLFALAGGVSPAHAQEAAQQAAARALFEEGLALVKSGDLELACTKFKASQALDNAPGTLLQLAGCYEKTGRTASAWATFQNAAARAEVEGRQDWAQLARRRAASLEPQLSRLAIRVAAGRENEGLVVRRDSTTIGVAEWNTPIPVDPGAHTVEASAPGKVAWKTTVSVAAEGASASIDVPVLASESVPAGPPPSAPATEPRPRESTTSWSGQHWVGVALVSAGVVGLGLGSFYGLRAFSKNDDAISHCPTPQTCDRDGLALTDSASSAATTSTVAFIAGGVLAAAGTVVFLSAPKTRAKAAVSAHSASVVVEGTLP
jgi:serine/threonine-protein kinase